MTMRRNIIALSLFEAAKALREQAEEAAAAPAPEGAPAEPGVPTDEETGEALTLDHILDRLNTIRSGKSFQDPEVYGKLTTIYKTMPNEDKVKLNQQLRNIGAVVQNQTPVGLQNGEQPAPEAVPAPPPAAPPAAPPPAAPPAV